MAKILIAEDDLRSMDVFSTAIESMGFCVIKAVNGKTAWEIMNANPDISMLVCDICMPEMDGRALIMCMKADTRLWRVPILAVSGVLRAREIATLLELGVAHFMPKPVNVQELTAAVRRLALEQPAEAPASPD